ncbi:glycosyltransferase family 2 protein [Mammaliicoccus sp. FSL K6-3158]|uniref:glycosyltransferase family 2 protein n=1 Tax=Mammaliicoccus TaxID=2803850 RepID=UPI000BD9FC3B|nr:glycosyltransferase family 2 protein [Mammaliicoccus sciuri]MEB8372603.1 glycosyltransferase family 2 protein [Mammaliicoccus sciuri]PCQ20339.1 glycosyl transferase family 2 [Klebsiella pneumoniae]
MISIIITVYNAENTINATINGIIKNCSNELFEIVIVNDGSQDDTFNILNKYKNVNNITIINQENQGVSKARNVGLKHVSKYSEYITFVDDSDMISGNFISEAKSFFENYKNINIAVSPILICKSESTYSHTLNYRFNNIKEYVDIIEDYHDIHFHIGGVVFRTSLFNNPEYKFNESISFWEDAALINTIILDQRYYGLLHNSNYYYDRNNTNSLSQIAWYSDARYTNHINTNYLPLITRSISKYGKVIDYIQYLITLHYLEYILEHNQKFINKMKNNLSKDFIDISKKLFENIDIKIIDQLKCPTRYKVFLYHLKGEVYPYHLRNNHIRLLIHHYKNKKILFSLSDDIGVSDDSSEITIYFRNKIQTKVISKRRRDVTIFGKKVNDLSLNNFEAKIPRRLILFGFKVKVKDLRNDNEIWIKSESLYKRLLRKFI